MRLSINQSTKIKISVIFVYIVSLIFNGLAGTKILGGNTTAEVSDSYPNLFAPAGITFAIWGVIYVALTIFCIKLFIKTKNQSAELGNHIDLLTKYFGLVSLFNFAWILAWQYRVFWLTVLLITGMLIGLIKISSVLYDKKLSNTDWVTLKLPFSIYFGWVTVATIANITIFLVSLNWSGWGISDQTWTITILIVGAIIGLVTSLRRKDWAYLMVFIWAYFGIWIKHTATNGWNNQYPTIINTLLILIALFAVTVLTIFYKYPKGVLRVKSSDGAK